MLHQITIQRYADVVTDDLKRHGRWVVANLELKTSWPVEVQKIDYDGSTFWVIPITEDRYPAVATLEQGGNSDDARRRVLQFLSVVSWVEGRGIALNSFSGGSLPYGMGRDKRGGLMVQQRFDFTYLPVVSDKKAQLALALMREGRGLNHAAFAFLSFFRALEVAVGKGDARRRWMPDAINRLTDHRAQEAVAQLRASGTADVALHLYQSGRCAIAHANADPIIDPDEPSDMRRLSEELPVMEGLAELAIEECLGVKTKQTIWREHLYELEGFKALFGQDLVDRLCRDEPIPEGTKVHIPLVNVGLRNESPFKALERLAPSQVVQVPGGVSLKLTRENGALTLACQLCFRDERLSFDIENGVYIVPDDGSSAYADMKGDLVRFFEQYMANGELQIVDAETGEVLSRRDAFIPLNCSVDHDWCRREAEAWQAAAAGRRELEAAEDAS